MAATLVCGSVPTSQPQARAHSRPSTNSGLPSDSDPSVHSDEATVESSIPTHAPLAGAMSSSHQPHATPSNSLTDPIHSQASNQDNPSAAQS
ncbi:hypothetical protein K457DRAFT_135687 [Linnemannia elongata AG-77]|uniref:Uncharacterized protein n=1 Tax=Linnemannia elongata AG-77 TaxID=1314771 RepID=A0A197K365_9FUNG|nr:hypothetical protein K457DRAFT_135687 [Linnemannia elongata AG-77]